MTEKEVSMIDVKSTVSTSATQHFAWLVLGPQFAGWMLEIFICGVCFHSATQLMTAKHMMSKKMRAVLIVTLMLLAMSLVTTIADLLYWGSWQERSQDDLWKYTPMDAYAPILAGLLAFVVQCFFADRAWKICDRSIVFGLYISLCILVSLAGSVGLGAVELLDTTGYGELSSILRLTQIWTWSAAVTDLSISIVIIFNLWSKRTGDNTALDRLVPRILSATMESAVMTTVFAVGAAIIDACTWDGFSSVVDYAFLIPLPAIYTFSLLWCLHATTRARQDQPHHERSLQASASPPSSSAPGVQSSTCFESSNGMPDHDIEKGTNLEFVTGSEFVLGMNTLDKNLFGHVKSIDSSRRQSRVASSRPSHVWPMSPTVGVRSIHSDGENMDFWEFIRHEK